MRIRFEFNNDEKYTIADACECPMDEDKDESETIEGRFGSIIYDKEDGFIECNLETGYIKAYTNIISMAFGMMKSLGKAFEVFIDAWASDVKIVKHKKSEDTSNIDDTKDPDTINE